MPYDKSKFHEIVIDKSRYNEYRKLLKYFGHRKSDLENCSIGFLLYEDEVLDSYLLNMHVERRIPATDIFNSLKIDTIWDIAFALSLHEVQHSTREVLTSDTELLEFLESKRIVEPEYSIFAEQSHSVFIWQHQIVDFLGLFFENHRIAEHYMKSLNRKRASEIARMDEIEIAEGKSLADYIWSHSFASGFGRPRLNLAHRIWKVFTNGKFVSHSLSRILQ